MCAGTTAARARLSALTVGGRLAHRHDVGHQALFTRVICTLYDHGLFDVMQIKQRHFDLSDFNPMASDLYLRILSPHIDQAAIGEHTPRSPVW
jgi:hypothetical protein